MQIKEMAKNIAMQITAMKPVYTNDSEVDEEYKAHELEIIKSQIENDPKDGRKAGEGYQRRYHGTSEQRAQRDLPA